MIAAAKAAEPLRRKSSPPAPAEEARRGRNPSRGSRCRIGTKGRQPAGAKGVDKSKMSIDDMVAWCREHDTE